MSLIKLCFVYIFYCLLLKKEGALFASHLTCVPPFNNSSSEIVKIAWNLLIALNGKKRAAFWLYKAEVQYTQHQIRLNFSLRIFTDGFTNFSQSKVLITSTIEKLKRRRHAYREFITLVSSWVHTHPMSTGTNIHLLANSKLCDCFFLSVCLW